MTCKYHPWYKGVYKSRTNCSTCKAIYFKNHGQEEHPIPRLGEREGRTPRWKRLLQRLGL